jgi:alkyl hydroperoxide reductase subunit AhpC
MTLQLGDIAPDFEAETTEGKLKFHDYIEGRAVWCPTPDFNFVCTTSLAHGEAGARI